jgi:hypothetical protein
VTRGLAQHLPRCLIRSSRTETLVADVVPPGLANASPLSEGNSSALLGGLPGGTLM